MIGGALIKDAVLVRGEAAAVKEDNDVVLDPCEGSGRSWRAFCMHADSATVGGVVAATNGGICAPICAPIS